MNTHYFIGDCTRRTVKLEDASAARIQFSANTRPIGTELDLPDDEHSSGATATLTHEDDPIGVKVCVWSPKYQPTHADVEAVLRGDAHPEGWVLGDGQIVAEMAVRKKTDSEGGKVTQHRFTVRVAVDDRSTFRSTMLGRFMQDREHVLSLSPCQVQLPEMPARGRPKKDAEADKQPGLNL